MTGRLRGGHVVFNQLARNWLLQIQSVLLCLLKLQLTDNFAVTGAQTGRLALCKLSQGSNGGSSTRLEVCLRLLLRVIFFVAVI